MFNPGTRKALRDLQLCSSHFTDEETEVHRWSGIGPRPQVLFEAYSSGFLPHTSIVSKWLLYCVGTGTESARFWNLTIRHLFIGMPPHQWTLFYWCLSLTGYCRRIWGNKWLSLCYTHSIGNTEREVSVLGVGEGSRQNPGLNELGPIRRRTLFLPNLATQWPWALALMMNLLYHLWLRRSFVRKDFGEKVQTHWEWWRETGCWVVGWDGERFQEGRISRAYSVFREKAIHLHMECTCGPSLSWIIVPLAVCWFPGVQTSLVLSRCHLHHLLQVFPERLTQGSQH